jgi:hypothetical protein
MLKLVPEVEYASPELEVIEHETDHPGVIRYRHQKGETVYVPWGLDRIAYESGSQDHIQLMEGIVRSLLGDDLAVETDAPGWIEITLHRQRKRNRLILHLVNHSGQDGKEVREPVTISDINLRIRAGELNSVRSTKLECKLETERRGPFLSFVLPRLELMDLLVIE